MDSNQTDPLIDQVIAGRYRVRKLLGEGGMGQVYLAEHEVIEKLVALKVLRPEYSRKEDIVTRFQQEAISASRIKHPNVLDVFDFGRLETGEAFLAMEFLEGHDLSDELAKVGVIPVQRGLWIGLQICRALAAAHGRGVVHRDMKPDNVFLQKTADGEEIVKIVDFGIAQLRSTEEAAQSEPRRRRLTKTGMIFGTPEYMAPEQAAGKKADLRVDIYAAGVILYEVFTGAVPFTGDSFMAVLAAHLNEPPPAMTAVNSAVDLSAELQQVILRALAKDPNDRYSSMAEFAQAIVGTPEGAPFAAMVPQTATADGRISALSAGMGGVATAGQFARASSNPPPGNKGTAAGPASGTSAFGTPEGARAHTEMSAETAPSIPTTSAKGWVYGSLGALVVAGTVAAGFLVTRGGEPPADATPSATALAAEPPSSTAPEPSGASSTDPGPASSTPIEPKVEVADEEEVTLHVTTEPGGAVLYKGGYQVCDSTPCDVIVDRDEGVDLKAEKDNLEGKAKILAQREQNVSITLKAPVVRRPKPKPKPKPKAEPEQKMCEVEVSGLKILRPCK